MLNSLQVSQLSTANRDSSCIANSDDDALSEYDEYDEDDGDEEDVVDTEGENTLVVCDFSKNIFSDLQTSPDVATTITDTSATLSKYSIGVSDKCVSKYKEDLFGNSVCQDWFT